MGRQRGGRLISTWTTVAVWRMHARVGAETVHAGPPIVLVHGLGVSSRYMIPTARLLAPHFRTYAPDLPGSGRSDRPSRVLDIPELADALAAWIRATRLEGAVLLGNSLGCQTITEIALRYPELIARAIFVGPTMDPRALTTRQQFWRLLLDSFREAPSQPFLTLFDYWMTGPYRTWRTLQYGLRDPLTMKLRRVRVPTLVVRGSRDPIVPQRWAEEVVRLLPYGRLVVIPGAAHTANYSTPRALARLVRAFLRDMG